jgi:transposase
MTKSNQIEVITSTERRRYWSATDKKAIVEQTYERGMSVSLIARKYDISPSQLFTWRRLMEEGSLEAVSSSDGVAPKSQVRALQKQIRELERLLGKRTLENEILQDALKLAQEKKLISRQPWLRKGGIQ